MNTRNLITILFIALLATSCTTVKQTARMEDPTSYINTVTIADLEVSEQSITFSYTSSKVVVNGGRDNVIKTAVAEALRKAGDYDVLVGLQYTTKENFFGKIQVINVKGYPAKYKNFHSLPDSIWEKTPLFNPSKKSAFKNSFSLFNK